MQGLSHLRRVPLSNIWLNPLSKQHKSFKRYSPKTALCSLCASLSSLRVYPLRSLSVPVDTHQPSFKIHLDIMSNSEAKTIAIAAILGISTFMMSYFKTSEIAHQPNPNIAVAAELNQENR